MTVVPVVYTSIIVYGLMEFCLRGKLAVCLINRGQMLLRPRTPNVRTSIYQACANMKGDTSSRYSGARVCISTVRKGDDKRGWCLLLAPDALCFLNESATKPLARAGAQELPIGSQGVCRRLTGSQVPVTTKTQHSAPSWFRSRLLTADLNVY